MYSHATAATIALALLLGSGCSSNDGGTSPDGSGGPLVPFVDQGATPPPPPPRDGGPPPPPPGDGPAPVVDQGSPPTPKDGGAPASDGGSGPPPEYGALCSDDQPCGRPEERCIYFSADGSPPGMCLLPCATQGDPCPVADPASQGSFCAITAPGDPQWYCGWFCLLGGQSFECPNATDYECVPDTDGKAEYCEPK